MFKCQITFSEVFLSMSNKQVFTGSHLNAANFHGTMLFCYTIWRLKLHVLWGHIEEKKTLLPLASQLFWRLFANCYYQNVQITWTVLLKKQQQLVSAKEITIECFKNSLRKFTKTLHKIQNILACGGLFSSLRSDFFEKLFLFPNLGPGLYIKIFSKYQQLIEKCNSYRF